MSGSCRNDRRPSLRSSSSSVERRVSRQQRQQQQQLQQQQQQQQRRRISYDRKMRFLMARDELAERT